MRTSRVATALSIAAVLASIFAGAHAAPDPSPRGVHLAFGADPTTSMTVVWHTPGTTERDTVVEYGQTSSLGSRATGTTKPAPGLPASLTSMLHEATIGGLQPGAPFFYRVGDGTTWSEVFAARTAPADGSFTFAAFGDHGYSAQAVRTTDALAAADPDFAVIAGDVSYANSKLERWDVWAAQSEPFAARHALMAAPGNHDTAPSETPTPRAFIDRFAFGETELYYSFDVGRAHFLMLHSTIDSANTRPEVAQQFAFAEQDLMAASQRKSEGSLDFIIVVQHHPLYASQDVDLASGAAERNYNPKLIAWQEPLFAAHDVDLLITGHNHHYERTFPIRAGQPTTTDPSTYVAPEGFIEVVTGGGGAGLYDVKAEGTGSFSAVRHKRFHYVMFEVEPGELRATAIATDAAAGEVLDRWTLRAS